MAGALPITRICERVLDVPEWEESVLFACERLSRRDRQGAEAVAASIVNTFGIDPVFAAEMIYRSSDATWTILGAQAQAFARGWLRKAPSGRATDFMVATGKSEFADDLWPLVANPDDDRSCFTVLRAGPRFRPSVLGPDPGARIAKLTEEHRARIVSEIAHNGGMDGLELAAELAKSDKSVKVKIEAVDALAFRHASGLLVSVLEDAPQDVWDHLASKWNPDEFDDPTIAERVRVESARRAETEKRSDARLYRLVRSPGICGDGRNRGAACWRNRLFAGRHLGTKLHSRRIREISCRRRARPDPPHCGWKLVSLTARRNCSGTPGSFLMTVQ